MRFFKEALTQNPIPETAPVPGKPVPMRTKEQTPFDPNERLTDLNGVARSLKVSKRYVQTLVRRKAIPVIRLGRRCTRFDLELVLAALRKFEVEEVGRR